MRLIEPLGLLHGPTAAHAIRQQLAGRLGGSSAYSLARLITPGAADQLLAPADLPIGWEREAACLAVAPSAWAGITLDRPRIMGILNLTPDSFSDGGRYADPTEAVAAALAMTKAGADLIDVGAESTRPGALPVPSGVECARLLPVITALKQAGILVSVDTRNAETMRLCLDAGAAIVNDVSGLTHDPTAALLLAERRCPVVLMHMRGTPQTMQDHTPYDDVAVEVCLELASRRNDALKAGIALAAMALDPGIGFAKTGAQNRILLDRLALFRMLGCAVLVGASRKRFLGGDSAADRLGGSVAASVMAARSGACILRVHDVAETVQALRLASVM